MAFGGERLNALDDPYAASAYTDPADAVLGIYIGYFPNDANGNLVPNEMGWAYWAGTSFSAPVISGDLARLVGEGATPTQAQARLHTTNLTAQSEVIVNDTNGANPTP